MQPEKYLDERGTECVHANTMLRPQSFSMSGNHCHSCYELYFVESGECCFLIEDKIKPLHLLLMLLGNLVAGYLFGLMFSVCDADIMTAAQAKVASWDFSWAFLIKSILCGVIMYLAVAIYRKGSKLGILFGIPLFILCGFQHCIANIITLGVAQTFSWTIILAIVGNFVGSLVTWYLCRSQK